MYIQLTRVLSQPPGLIIVISNDLNSMALPERAVGACKQWHNHIPINRHRFLTLLYINVKQNRMWTNAVTMLQSYVTKM
jgi:hypothetical protein